MNKFNVSIYVETSNGSGTFDAEYDCLDESISTIGKRHSDLFSGPCLIVQNLYLIYEDEETGKEYYGDIEGEFDDFSLIDNDFSNKMLDLYEARVSKQKNKEIIENFNEITHEQNQIKANLIGQSYTDFKNLDCLIIDGNKKIPAVINGFKGTIQLPEGYLKIGEGSLNIQGNSIEFTFSSDGNIDNKAHKQILNKFEEQSLQISEKVDDKPADDIGHFKI